jgi:hypothetical protein
MQHGREGAVSPAEWSPNSAVHNKLERAAAAIEDWLDAQAPDSASSTEEDADDLRRISTLARAGASEAEMARAVAEARETGWSWGPIAVLLGQTRAQVRARFDPSAPGRTNRHPRQPGARLTRWRELWRVPQPRTHSE